MKPTALILLAALVWMVAACAALKGPSAPLPRPVQQYYIPMDMDGGTQLCVEVRPDDWVCPTFDELRTWMRTLRRL